MRDKTGVKQNERDMAFQTGKVKKELKSEEHRNFQPRNLRMKRS
jgi:hypothetical protein